MAQLKTIRRHLAAASRGLEARHVMDPELTSLVERALRRAIEITPSTPALRLIEAQDEDIKG